MIEIKEAYTLRTCWNCKSFISCLHAGEVHTVDNMGLVCEWYEREDQLPMEEIKVIDGVVYRRIIEVDKDGET